ncbi:hypothetical protein GCM10011583_18580 [Streptomyces camponoticapitis]|uniref:Uncharacterized protein n=1 Tax=Streptomyces camponoticapitis TaxID=1616125 RepID=A0ABQ2E1G8_9ACTN|nr:hypothetical protein [Streptomyces camponoticapitis]GGJ87311.1 hypothetical protein GCM10011583_18580 [Streptomyces camponoticapitis]
MSDIAKRFASHKMTVLHEDGLYRHLRFEGTADSPFSRYPFELITWPYNLVVKSGWTFHFDIDATPDMLDLFRKTAFSGEINPGYWQEKVRAGRDEIEDFDIGLFERQVKEHVVQAIREGSAPRGLGREVTKEIFEWGNIDHEAGARSALDSFKYKGWTFGETWEWDFDAFTPGFLHSCHAIRHGVDLYDAARKAVAA